MRSAFLLSCFFFTLLLLPDLRAGNRTINRNKDLSVSFRTDAQECYHAEFSGFGISTPDTTAVSDSLRGGTSTLTKAVFLEKVWNFEKNPREWVFLGDKPALIDFYADWCGPCRMAAPILEELSHEYAGKIDIYKVNTQKEQELAFVFGVRSIPVFLYIPLKGKPVMMAGISRTAEDTKKMFIENFNRFLLPAAKK